MAESEAVLEKRLQIGSESPAKSGRMRSSACHSPAPFSPWTERLIWLYFSKKDRIIIFALFYQNTSFSEYITEEIPAQENFHKMLDKGAESRYTENEIRCQMPEWCLREEGVV